MTNQRTTLIQTIASLETFYEFRERKAIPLLLKLQREEIRGLWLGEYRSHPSSMNPSYLYYLREKTEHCEAYLSLSTSSLASLIQNGRIYIPEFIDIHATKKYIDYILVTYHSALEQSDSLNPLCTDYRHRILFRNRKRIFEKLGSNQDFVRGQFNENPNTILLSELIQETLDNKEQSEQNGEKIKALLSNKKEFGKY